MTEVLTETKTCTGPCGEDKPLDAFRARGGTKCKECLNGDNRQYRANQREKRAAALQGVTKVCSACKVPLELDKFTLLHPQCNKCRSIARTKAYAANPKTRRQSRITKLRKYGLTIENFDVLLAAQGGKCAICCSADPGCSGHTATSFSVDHDHETGEVRGLLCRRCNTGIGMLGDSVEGLRKAVQYLENSE